MARASTVRRNVAEVSRRLLALLEESVTPANAVQILVTEEILSSQTNVDPALPLSSAIHGIIPRPGALPDSAASVGDYVRACESRGCGDAALRLLSRLTIRRVQGRVSLAAIGIEFLLLFFVLLIHSLFVLPQFKAMYDAAGKPLPAFTQLVVGLIRPSGPFLWIGVSLLLVLIFWRVFPLLLGPLLRPLDRVLLTLPLVGTAIRQSNSDRISGWLGFAGPDASSQRGAIEAARAWFLGDLLARECGAVLATANTGKDINACLAQAPGFDREFHNVIALADRADSLAALRARWRIADTLPERRSTIEPALVQVALGVLVAAIVIALYLPIFKLAALM